MSLYSVSCTTMVSGLAQAVVGVGYFGVGGLLPPSISNLQITVSTATNNAITLPNNVPNGTIIRIRNDGAFFSQIFPYSGGSIDGLTADNAIYIAQNGGQKSFICNGTNTWLTITDNGVSPIFSLTASAVITGCANYAGTLSKAHSNSIIMLDNTAANAVVNLPAVATSRGLKYKFITGLATATRSSTITPATAVMNGPLSLYIAATNGGATPTSIVKTDSADYAHNTSSALGDWSSVCSDGTKWYCAGTTKISNGFV